MKISIQLIIVFLILTNCNQFVQGQDSYPPISNIQSVQQPGGNPASTIPGGGAAPPPGATTRGGASTEPFTSGNSLQGNAALMKEYDEADKLNANGSPNYYIDSDEDTKRKNKIKNDLKRKEAENNSEKNKDVFDYWKNKRINRAAEKKEIQKDVKKSNEYFESPDF